MSIAVQFINLFQINSSVYREKRKAYYESRNDIKSYDHFLKRVNENKYSAKSQLHANTRIKPFGLGFDLSKQEVVSKLGKPAYVLEKTDLDKHQIVFYKKRTATHNYLLQVHFVKGKMVYALNNIREIAKASEGFFNKIARMLLNKYSLNIPQEIVALDSVICDDYNNSVSITETLGLNVRYVSGSVELINFLRSKLELKNMIGSNVEMDQLNKLYNFI